VQGELAQLYKDLFLSYAKAPRIPEEKVVSSVKKILFENSQEFLKQERLQPRLYGY
jgi:hypothetical protein